LKDASLARSGFQRVQLFGGKPGVDKVSVSGRSANLPLRAPATVDRYFRNEGDVVVQLVGNDGECWEARFAADRAKNEEDGYKASFTP
jgi:hypothetical protein